jgi:hypothetical protein
VSGRVRDEELVSGRELDVVVTLQDGRVLDGLLIGHEHVMQCERVVFEPWQIDKLFPQQETGSAVLLPAVTARLVPHPVLNLPAARPALHSGALLVRTFQSEAPMCCQGVVRRCWQTSDGPLG